MINVEERKFGAIFRVSRQVHNEALDVMLKQHVFTLAWLRFNVPETWPSTFATHGLELRIVMPSFSTRIESIAAFKHYHLKITISDEGFLPGNDAFPVLVIGLSALSSFCTKTATYPKPVRDNGPLVRDLHYDIDFNQAVIKPSGWDERVLLMPFLHSGVKVQYADEKRDLPLLLGFSGPWRDYPHVTIRGTIDQAQARQAERVMTSPRWTSVKQFVQFIHKQYEESIRLWEDGEFLAAISILMPLDELVMVTEVSRQARAFRRGPNAELFRDTMAFFSYACPLTGCSVLLSMGKQYSRGLGGNEGLNLLAFAQRALDAVEKYHGSDRKTSGEYIGIATLCKAQAYRLMRKPKEMNESLRAARLVLKDQYDLFAGVLEKKSLRLVFPRNFATEAGIEVPDIPDFRA